MRNWLSYMGRLLYSLTVPLFLLNIMCSLKKAILRFPHPIYDKKIYVPSKGPFLYHTLPMAWIELISLPSIESQQSPSLQPDYINKPIPQTTNFNPKDGGSMFLQNISIHLQDYLKNTDGHNLITSMKTSKL
jgi:hypothetical protein